MNTPKCMQSLTRLFEALNGGHIVAVSSPAAGAPVRLIIENQAALSGIRGSWGRVAVTLAGCRIFSFSASDDARSVDLTAAAARMKPSVRAARCQSGVCRVECDYPFGMGALEIDAETFSLMLGSGRYVSLVELLEGISPGEPAYAKAS